MPALDARPDRRFRRRGKRSASLAQRHPANRSAHAGRGRFCRAAAPWWSIA